MSSSNNYIDNLPRDIRELVAAYTAEAEERRRIEKFNEIKERFERKRAKLEKKYAAGDKSHDPVKKAKRSRKHKEINELGAKMTKIYKKEQDQTHPHKRALKKHVIREGLLGD